MSPLRVPPSYLPAYYHAAQALLAVDFGIEVLEVSIKPDQFGRTWTKLEALQDACNLNKPRSRNTVLELEHYVTTLIGGLAGRQVKVEMEFGYMSRCAGRVALQRKFQAMLYKCDKFDTDRAFAIALGWLDMKDNGNTINTLERLWLGSLGLMRNEQNRIRLEKLAQTLKETPVMGGNEVWDLIGE